jgi:hypothetical protein
MKPQFLTDLGLDQGCLHWDTDGEFLADTITLSQPRNILEIGFFRGSSAACLLHLSDANLTSVDPMVNLYDPNVKHDGLVDNAEKLKAHFPGRFTFIQKDSKLVRPDLVDQQFDLVFIDGDHTVEGARHDFQLALDLNIPWVLVDDFVTSVLDVYNREFADKFLPPIRVYPRKDLFMGQPIPIVLLRQIDKKVEARYNG